MRNRNVSELTAILFLCVSTVLISNVFAGEWPKSMHIYSGSTPKIDGIIDDVEYDDAITFMGVDGWTPQFLPVTDRNDYSVKGWVKHDGKNLYFAFDVADDVLYGIDTQRWLPSENPKAHELTREGWPWFGDGIEILMNPTYKWSQEDGELNSGNGSSWQMVCNVTKSRLGGIGKGGLMEGEERSLESAWNTYQEWIKTGAMKAAVKIKDNKKGYTIEWMVKANPCLEVSPGNFWTPDMGTVKMGFNIGTQDLDEKEKGEGNFGNFYHEDWWAGERDKRTWLKQWGTIVIHPGKKPFEVYVAPDALNGGTGTKQNPFTMLEQARDVARNKNDNVIVYLRDGTYWLSKTFELDQRDSNVTYKAYPGEKPLISGGRLITDWEKHENGIWKAKADFEFRQFYVNGNRAIRARTPNGLDQFYRLKAWDSTNKKIVINKSDFNINLNSKNIEMIVQQRWSTQVLRLDSYSISDDNVRMKIKSPEDMVFIRPHPPKKPDQGYHFENAYEFLDQPGEWFLDRESKTVYYKPVPQQDMRNIQAIAPYTETLISIQGTLDKPVKNIQFAGLAFAHSNWIEPNNGKLDTQVGMYNLSADADNNQYVGRPKSAVYLAAAHQIQFHKNIFKHIGACALDLHFGTVECEVTGNVFADISGNGIQHSIFSKPDVEMHVPYNPEDKREICTNDIIANNYFSKAGQDYKGCVAIACGWPRGIRIERNEIENMPYSGISVGWGWCNVPNVMNSNLIRYNHVHNVGNLLADCGGIYVLSHQPSSEISHNYVHDLIPSKWAIGPMAGIYLDEGSDGFHVHNNRIENAGQLDIFRHLIGLNNRFYNNYVKVSYYQNPGSHFIREYINWDTAPETIKQQAGLKPAYRYIKNLELRKVQNN